MPEARQLRLIRNIVSAAFRLNEHFVIKADDIWKLVMIGHSAQSHEKFYPRMDSVDMKPVGTALALQQHAPLNTVSQRLAPRELRDRVQMLCSVAPRLLYQHIEEDGTKYKKPVALVKPQVLVALKQLPPARGEPEPAAAEPDEVVFYTMATRLGPAQ
jgi:hypothetical protein